MTDTLLQSIIALEQRGISFAMNSYRFGREKHKHNICLSWETPVFDASGGACISRTIGFNDYSLLMDCLATVTEEMEKAISEVTGGQNI